MSGVFVLRASPESFRTRKILVAARYSGVDVTVLPPESSSSSSSSSSSGPAGRLPVLEIAGEEGGGDGGGGGERNPPLFGSNAIARYIVRAGGDRKNVEELLGKTSLEMARVDGWVEYASNELEVPSSVWTYPVLGKMPFRESAYNKAKSDLSKSLALIDAHLLNKTYLVGQRITLADVAVASALLHPLTLVCDASYREPHCNVVRWFLTCINQPEFKAVLGELTLCEEEKMPPGQQARCEQASANERHGGKGGDGSKKGKKKKQKKKKKKTREEAGEGNAKASAPAAASAPAPPPPPKKRAEHPYRVMDREQPSSFSVDSWKRTYSNASSYDADLMAQFWKAFDHEGWSLWYQTYNHQEENTRVFITSNRIGGFQQRSEEIRRWAFGVMDVLGTEESGLEVKGVWLLRGDTADHMIEANDDANWYTWKKLAGRGMPPTDEAKMIVADYWCSENVLEGKPVQDSKVFK